MTPEMIRAYRIADNKLAELAGWDADILKIEFQNLIELDPNFDLTVTGFEMAEIDLLIGDEPVEEKEEEFEDLLKPEPVSRPGDLWLLGDHRLLCGNALNRDDYSKLMGDALAHVVFTDPPYNVRVKDIGGLGKPFAWPRDIVYFGVSGALKSRLRQFDNTISRKRKEHGGADRVLYAYPDYSALTPELYVSILAVGETAAGDTAECWRRIGDARRLEYHCVAEHLERHGQLPQFNRGDSPKFSKIEPEA